MYVSRETIINGKQYIRKKDIPICVIIGDIKMAVFKKSTINEAERKDMMDFMAAQLNAGPQAKVGIFWYNKEKDSLFLVQTVDCKYAPSYNGKKTINTLHKFVWQKSEIKGEVCGDYTEIPRGRVFFNEKTNTFEIMLGHWAEEYGLDHIVDLVINEFDLQNQKVVSIFDKHWEIGQGFSM
jgi:hypothetical protein